MDQFYGSSCKNLASKFRHPEALTSLRFCEVLFDDRRSQSNGASIASVLLTLEKQIEEINALNIEDLEKEVLLRSFRALVETLRGYSYLGMTTVRSEAGKAIAELLAAWDKMKSEEGKKYIKSIFKTVAGLAVQAGFRELANTYGDAIKQALGFDG